mmetsp:Transcript_38514/g.101610  ORF Transcript_38514/g.101610 Transcript_38514/m.101610 type:complete len:298 (-) Transcript_38514:922-1815(-)
MICYPPYKVHSIVSISTPRTVSTSIGSDRDCGWTCSSALKLQANWTIWICASPLHPLASSMVIASSRGWSRLRRSDGYLPMGEHEAHTTSSTRLPHDNVQWPCDNREDSRVPRPRVLVLEVMARHVSHEVFAWPDGMVAPGELGCGAGITFGDAAPGLGRSRGEMGVCGERGVPCPMTGGEPGGPAGKRPPGIRGEVARGGSMAGVRPRLSLAHGGSVDDRHGLDDTEERVDDAVLNARSESSSISVSRRARSMMAAARISRSRVTRWHRPAFSLCSRPSSLRSVSLPRRCSSHSTR